MHNNTQSCLNISGFKWNNEMALIAATGARVCMCVRVWAVVSDISAVMLLLFSIAI